MLKAVGGSVDLARDERVLQGGVYREASQALTHEDKGVCIICCAWLMNGSNPTRHHGPMDAHVVRASKTLRVGAEAVTVQPDYVYLHEISCYVTGRRFIIFHFLPKSKKISMLPHLFCMLGASAGKHARPFRSPAQWVGCFTQGRQRNGALFIASFVAGVAL